MWRYCTVITVIFHYYTVSLHDTTQVIATWLRVSENSTVLECGHPRERCIAFVKYLKGGVCYLY